MKIIKNTKTKKDDLVKFDSHLPEFSVISRERKREKAISNASTSTRSGFGEKFDKIEKLYDIKVKRAFQRGLKEGSEKTQKEIKNEFTVKHERETAELKENYEEEIKTLKQVNREKINSMFEEFEKQVDKFQKSFVNIAENYHKETMKISLAIVKKIIAELSDKDKNVISRNIFKALNKIEKKIPCILKLHPDDLKYFNNNSSALEKLADDTGYKIENIEIIPDEKIETGGCVVETDSFTIDARLSEQFDKVKKALKENYLTF